MRKTCEEEEEVIIDFKYLISYIFYMTDFLARFGRDSGEPMQKEAPIEYSNGRGIPWKVYALPVVFLMYSAGASAAIYILGSNALAASRYLH